MNVQNYAENLIYKDGLWFSEGKNAVSYPKDGNLNCYQIEQDSFWFNHRNNCIIEMVKKYSYTDVFFDIGGGNGFVAKGLEENNISTVLVEPGIEGALNAKKRGVKTIICATLEDAGFKINKINSIGLFDVVEHIEDDYHFMASINSYLVNEGLVYITVPSYDFLWSKEDTDAGHFRRYTIKKMNKLLKDTGFKIEYSSYIFSVLPVPIFLFRTIPSYLGFYENSNELNKHKKDHSRHKGILGKTIDKILEIEIEKIKMEKSMLFGGSCFIVGRKTESC